MKLLTVIAICVLLAVAGGLVGIKVMQIKKLTSTPHVIPPETIASAVAHEEKWQDSVSAIGSITAVQGVTLTPEIAGTVWQKNIEIADKYYKPGKFTTFVAYEWTSMPNASLTSCPV